jgi:Cof subfamily protein (haloacid dehalogenase superfamily)
LQEKDEIMKLPSFGKHPRAIAIDLDGTLFNNRTEISSRNREAVLRCVTKGIPVIIATSRSERSTRLLCGTEIENHCSLVVMNGAIAKAAPPLSGTIKEKFAPGVAKGIVGLAIEEEPDIRITIEIEGYEFGVNWKADPDLLWKLNSATPDMVLSMEEALERNPAKIAISNMGRDMSSIGRIISQRFDGLVSVISSNENTFLHILNAKTSKPNAVGKLLESQNIGMEEVMAFGDDMPDFGMLSLCGFPVAMANAIPEIKAICKYLTVSNDEDGVAIVLEKMLEKISD